MADQKSAQIIGAISFERDFFVTAFARVLTVKSEQLSPFSVVPQGDSALPDAARYRDTVTSKNAVADATSESRFPINLSGFSFRSRLVPDPRGIVEPER